MGIDQSKSHARHSRQLSGILMCFVQSTLYGEAIKALRRSVEIKYTSVAQDDLEAKSRL